MKTSDDLMVKGAFNHKLRTAVFPREKDRGPNKALVNSEFGQRYLKEYNEIRSR